MKDWKLIEGKNMVISRLREKKDIWNVWSIYNTGNLKEVLKLYMEEYEFKEGEKIIIGGDFNIRTGNLGSFVYGELVDVRKRKSKDMAVGNEERHLI